jgi:hypothetical protein
MYTLTHDGDRWTHTQDLARYLRRVLLFRVLESLPVGVHAVDSEHAAVLDSYTWELSGIAENWIISDYPPSDYPGVILVIKRPRLVPNKPRLAPDPYPPCCEVAVARPCVCDRHWTCEVHGEKSYGSHD